MALLALTAVIFVIRRNFPPILTHIVVIFIVVIIISLAIGTEVDASQAYFMIGIRAMIYVSSKLTIRIVVHFLCIGRWVSVFSITITTSMTNFLAVEAPAFSHTTLKFGGG